VVGIEASPALVYQASANQHSGDLGGTRSKQATGDGMVKVSSNVEATAIQMYPVHQENRQIGPGSTRLETPYQHRSAGVFSTRSGSYCS
jgi:hypothetical protein